MKQTQNYQLSQWEKTDRIEMEDFNEDNRKIDAALAAEKQARENADAAQLSTLRGENLWVKLKEVKLSSSVSSYSLTLPSAAGYQRLQVHFNFNGTGDITVLFNDGAEVYLTSTGTKVSAITVKPQNHTCADGELVLRGCGSTRVLSCYQNAVSMDPSTGYASGASGFYTVKSLTLDGLTKLKFVSDTGAINKGATFSVYGMKQ